jgi:hypothetical protein
MSFVAGRHLTGLALLTILALGFGPDRAVSGRWHQTSRANASRECAPDDKLREAIQNGRRKQLIASSLALLATTPRHNLAVSPRSWREFA